MPNPSHLAMQVLGHLWPLIPLALLGAILKSAWFKGWLGEAIVNLSIKHCLDPRDYRLLRNVTLPFEDGTTQIDHIIVSRFGVFVIETKNMKGWIFGGERQKTWTQKIYRHSVKFQNPLHQNYKHVKALEALLGIDGSAIHSVVVFIGGSTFKTPMPENVTQAFGFLRYVKARTAVLLSDAQVSDAVERIESGRLPASFATHRAHVRHVRGIVGKTK